MEGKRSRKERGRSEIIIMWTLCKLGKKECGYSKVVDNVGLGVINCEIEISRKREFCFRII